ncbi:hypothetical protein Tco_0240047, partial [Tanacetum coccineum]
ESGCQTSTKEVSLRDRVKALEGLCDSLMILPKDIKSLKARVYKLETIINVITKKRLKYEAQDKLKSVGKQCDVGDKYWSDQDDDFDDLVDENGFVQVEKDISQVKDL